ncbi:MAG: glucokinase [Verrucomicrobia bacterium]|jgi:glucokinase|nr:MAG: glucokinase [Verrucomicrobiota bacterium]
MRETLDVDSPLAIGLDFGGTSIKIGVCQGPIVVKRSEPIATIDHDSVEALIEAMVREISHLRAEHPAICAVGAGVPGFVNFADGFIHQLTNVPGWQEIPFRDILEAKIGLPVSVENDANAMAYAEWRHGAARGMQHAVCVTLGTGVGGGLILNGELFRGATYGAGEIGQMSIDGCGTRGNYGNFGALEKYVGNQQIEEHALKLYARAGKLRQPGECTPQRLAEAAKQMDPIALQVWNDVADWLGTALSSIVWLLNPDAVVVGGGVSQAGDLLFGPLSRRMQSTLNPVFWERLRLLPARFGNEAGIIGCAALALQEARKRSHVGLD